MISLGSLRIAGWVLLFSEMNTGSRTICILMNSASAHTIRVKAQDIMPISPLFALPNVLQEISTGTQVSNYIIVVDAPEYGPKYQSGSKGANANIQLQSMEKGIPSVLPLSVSKSNGESTHRLI